MHGLINRSLESFIRATYGDGLWSELIGELDLGFSSFEPMLRYDDAVTQALIDTAADRLDKPRAALLEDFGTFLIAHPVAWRVRRLLRFGGVDYEDFLHSLGDLQGRARLAVPDLELPRLELIDHGQGSFTLNSTTDQVGFGYVLLGVLRAMADDYGALVFLEYLGRVDGCDSLSIRLLEAQFAEGRDFTLSAGTG
jgi:hypothetical protein